MPTRRRPPSRPFFACAAAASRPFDWGSESRTIVQPRRPDGHVIAAGLDGARTVVVGAVVVAGAVSVVAVVGSGAVSVGVPPVTVKLPPVAVGIAVYTSPSL